MTDVAATTARTNEMLDRLSEMDLAAAEFVDCKLLEAKERVAAQFLHGFS